MTIARKLWFGFGTLILMTTIMALVILINVRRVDRSLTEVTAVEELLPQRARFLGVYPSPFNPRTSFVLELSKEETVRIVAFNAVGRQVATIHEGPLPAGRQEVQWDAGASEAPLASGVYYVKIQFAGQHILRKVVLLK